MSAEPFKQFAAKPFASGHRDKSWTWLLPVPPADLWPILSDTARFNEAIGTPRYFVTEIPQADGSVIRRTEANYKGVKVVWNDPPYEWVFERNFSQRRDFETGPLRYMGVAMDLAPEALPDGRPGSRVTYRFYAAPRGILGRLLLLTGLVDKAGEALGRILTHMAEHLQGRQALAYDYTPPPPPPGAMERLRGLIQKLAAGPYAHGLAPRLEQLIITGQEVDLMRIRPRKLARDWHVPTREVAELCLDATRQGLLSMSWNLLCPRCGGAKVQSASLEQLPKEAHCSSCNVEYDASFTENVEVSFQPVAAIRPIAGGEFCMGGPHVSRHILVQQHLEPGESRQVTIGLRAGEYRIRALERGGESRLAHDGGAFPAVIAKSTDGTDFAVEAGPKGDGQTITLENRTRRGLTLLIESREWREDAFTANQLTTLQAFRDLMPEQVLRPGEDISIDNVTLLFTDLEGSTALYERLGDGAAYRLVRRHFGFLAERVREHDGALVKTIGDAVMAAFSDPGHAVEAALAVQQRIAAFNEDFRAETAREGNPVDAAVVLKMGLHSGRCIAVNLNNRLDYFGSTVNMAARLQAKSRGGEIVLSQTLAMDPGVAPLIRARNQSSERAELKGFETPVPFLRLTA